MALSAGTTAPGFTLKSKSTGVLTDISLSDHAGKDNVVLLFVPGAFTSVCTKQFCDISGGFQEIPNAVVYGISVDSAFAQEAWAKQNNMNLTLLSDFTHQVTKEYDVVLDDLAGLGPASKRASFIIDKSGVIVYSETTPTTLDLPNYEAINAALEAL